MFKCRKMPGLGRRFGRSQARGRTSDSSRDPGRAGPYRAWTSLPSQQQDPDLLESARFIWVKMALHFGEEWAKICRFGSKYSSKADGFGSEIIFNISTRLSNNIYYFLPNIRRHLSPVACRPWSCCWPPDFLSRICSFWSLYRLFPCNLCSLELVPWIFGRTHFWCADTTLFKLRYLDFCPRIW